MIQIVICLIIAFGIMVFLGYTLTDASIRNKEHEEMQKKILQHLEEINKKNPDE